MVNFVGNLLTNCLSVFDHFVELALKGLSVMLDYLTLLCIMLKNGQTCFKNLVVFTLQNFLIMFGHFSKLYLRLRSQNFLCYLDFFMQQ